MSLTVLESKRLEIVIKEIEILWSVVQEYSNMIEYFSDIQKNFLPQLEGFADEKDHEAIAQCIRDLSSSKRFYKKRIEQLGIFRRKSLSMGHRSYDSNARMYRLGREKCTMP